MACDHLPVVTRAVLPKRRSYWLRCWLCEVKWGPLTHSEAFKMWGMVNAVRWSDGHD